MNKEQFTIAYQAWSQEVDGIAALTSELELEWLRYNQEPWEFRHLLEYVVPTGECAQ